MDNPVAASILGTTGAVCWSIQLIPQIIVNYRRHHTTGLQPTMMMLWAVAGIPLGVYNITQNFNIALQIQAQILTFLSLVTWAQCKYYRDGGQDARRWSLLRCIAVLAGIGTLMGGVEVALVFALQQAVRRHLEWPGIIMAVLAALLLSAGVARHYWDIYKERTVRGISFIFVGIDALGDLTSLISLLFQPELDVLGLVIYGSELVLWLGVFACGGWFNFRPWAQSVRSRWVHERETDADGRCQRAEYHRGHMVDNDGTQAESFEMGSRLRRPSSSSSTSVFRTASGTLSERRRYNNQSNDADTMDNVQV